MVRKTVSEVCQVCGNRARKINYVSRSKGRTYYYFKFVHSNGVVHYLRKNVNSINESFSIPRRGISTLDMLEEIVDLKMSGREMKFSEIKSELENSYGRTVGKATLYRNLNKFLKLDLITKRINGRAVLYGKKSERTHSDEVKTTMMSLGLDLTHEESSVAMFIHIRNLGLRVVDGYSISLPMGGVESPDNIGLNAFDETNRIILRKEHISYSSSDRTGVSVKLNIPLRKFEEVSLFLNYKYEFQNRPIKIMTPSSIDLLKINCEIKRGEEVQIEKRLSDGMKEIDPPITRRTGNIPGHIIVEAEFEYVTRGDTIVVSLARKE